MTAEPYRSFRLERRWRLSRRIPSALQLRYVSRAHYVNDDTHEYYSPNQVLPRYWERARRVLILHTRCAAHYSAPTLHLRAVIRDDAFRQIVNVELGDGSSSHIGFQHT